MTFVAVDVETANADISSICQIGLAHFRDGSLVEEWTTYIDPEDYFDEINTSIHGIDETVVKDSPTLPQITDRMLAFLDQRVAVCHTHFDRVAILQACGRYRLRLPACTWLDSARIARRAWKAFAWKGYGLANVCSTLGHQFVHHDALEDAKAAAHVVHAAVRETGIGLQEWLRRVEEPIDPLHSSGHIARDGNPRGPFHGEILVFTGALSLLRCQAADMAARAGFSVGVGVTKETSVLVVGDQDVRKLAGNEKSAKHRKADKLMREGQAIRIIGESAFRELVSCCEPRGTVLQMKAAL